MSLARRSQAGVTLIDSQRHGAGCELFLVEGESAAGAVAAVRDARTQAVLACQGKPLNAWRATPARVAAYPLYPQLASALGWSSVVDSSATAAPRFERVMLLFDAQARDAAASLWRQFAVRDDIDNRIFKQRPDGGWREGA